jgi:5-methylcytosine-specific restriction endonuclease McrA
MIQKTCRNCGISQSTDNFHKDRSRSDGLTVLCKPCNSKKACAWAKANPSKHNATARKNYVDNIDRYRELGRAKIARRRERLKVERRNLFEADPCVYCGGVSDTNDHIYPIAKGGTDHFSNMARACGSCNSSKNDTHLLQYMLRNLDSPSPNNARTPKWPSPMTTAA